jgi:hypothetical protein
MQRKQMLRAIKLKSDAFARPVSAAHAVRVKGHISQWSKSSNSIN